MYSIGYQILIQNCFVILFQASYIYFKNSLSLQPGNESLESKGIFFHKMGNDFNTQYVCKISYTQLNWSEYSRRTFDGKGIHDLKITSVKSKSQFNLLRIFVRSAICLINHLILSWNQILDCRNFNVSLRYNSLLGKLDSLLYVLVISMYRNFTCMTTSEDLVSC